MPDIASNTVNAVTSSGLITPDLGEGLSVAVYVAATVAGLIITYRNRTAFRNITRAKEDHPAEGTTVAALENAPPSFSRISGIVGVAYLLAFCWALGFYILTKVWHDPSATTTVVSGSADFIMTGSALFAPYAFNQLSQVFGRRGNASTRSAHRSGASVDQEVEDLLTA